MTPLPLTLATLILASPHLLAVEGIATLNVVEEDGFNQIELDLNPPLLAASSDSTTLSGTVQVKLEIDPENDQVSEITVIDADLEGTAIELSAGNAGANYSFESEGLGATLHTPNPPGIVDPATGEFDASEHELTVNQGQMSGQIFILFVANETVDFDFASMPFGGAGAGTGTVELTPKSSTATTKTYDVAVVINIEIADNVAAGGFEIPIGAAGMMKAAGTVTVPLEPADPYTVWADVNGIADAPFEGDENGDGTPNGLQWALGLNADDSPKDFQLRPIGLDGGTVEFRLTLPEGGTAADITIEVSENPGTAPFELLDAFSVTAGNPIPAQTSGEVVIKIPRVSATGFVRLSVEKPTLE